MKHIFSGLFLGLVMASAAAAEDVNRADLYVSCIDYQNAKWKAGSSGTLNYLTASQLKQLAPFNFALMKQECDCTVTAAFKFLSESTIAAYNTSLQAKGDGIALNSDAATKEFKTAGMVDKKIACTEKSLESSGYSKKLQELSK
ncbi:hypothetical protein OO012_18130 [Rhodobacteraceae bacterium KMM 6894]|nr:hypothetical protein [Rhodobacteraceae bacterium KMM 6894]